MFTYDVALAFAGDRRRYVIKTGRLGVLIARLWRAVLAQTPDRQFLATGG